MRDIHVCKTTPFFLLQEALAVCLSCGAPALWVSLLLYVFVSYAGPLGV